MNDNTPKNTDGWCILRCAGASTLRLRDSLVEAGIDAWTPQKLVTKRSGRARERTEVPAAILPTFLFARAVHISELQRCRSMPINPHPGFSIFRHLDRIPVVADRDITALRAEEERAAKVVLRRTRRTVPIGSKVTMPEGAFAGLTGIVEQSDGKAVLVTFGGNFSVSIAAWLLPEDKLEPSSSTKDVAARAA